MLRSYPVEATFDNWVHDTFYGKVRAALDAIDGGYPAPAWETDLPQSMMGRPSLTERYDDFVTAALGLNQVERALVRDALIQQNDIPGVFEGAPCPQICELPISIRSPIRRLFEAGFELLRHLGIRDSQYRRIYDSLVGKNCPFCGLEDFDAPGQPREDLDHYLLESVYPFAGANLRNLAPMGKKCNSSYKRAANIIVDAQGERRPCLDPYGDYQISVSLAESIPFAGELRGGIFPLPAWVIEFEGADAHALETWDTVFSIRERYSRNWLDPNYQDCLGDFAFWCFSQNRILDTAQELILALTEYKETCLRGETVRPNFLRRALFDMLRRLSGVEGDPHGLASWLITYVTLEREQHATRPPPLLP